MADADTSSESIRGLIALNLARLAAQLEKDHEDLATPGTVFDEIEKVRGKLLVADAVRAARSLEADVNAG